jgi:hypothetical protein
MMKCSSVRRSGHVEIKAWCWLALTQPYQSPTEPPNHQEVAENKKKARANRQRFQDNRDKYLEEMRQAFKLMQLKEREESGFRWVKRPKRDQPAIPLHELRLGSKHDGVVITVKEHGAYVDFGATRDGFVRLRVRACLRACVPA